MSITITPGTVIADDTDITPTVLNLIANPVATTTAGTVTATDVLNYFHNEDFNKWSLNLDSASVGTTKEYISRHWFMQTAGAAVAVAGQDSNDDTVLNNRGAHALKITGATSVTSVDLGQFIPQAIAQELFTTNFTVAFYCYNNTGTSVTPTLRVSTANSTDSSGDVTFISSTNMTACPDSAWTLCKVTIDGTLLGANTPNGIELIVRLGSTLSAGDETWFFQMAQLVTGLDANTAPPRQLFNPSIPVQYFAETQPNGTDGGGSSASAYANVRAFNQREPEGTPAKMWGCYGTVSGGNVLLAPGVYWIKCRAAFHDTAGTVTSQLAVQVETTATGGSFVTQLEGPPSVTPANIPGWATVEGMIHVDELSADVKVLQNVSNARAADGLGLAGATGVEIYAEMFLWRISDPV